VHVDLSGHFTHTGLAALGQDLQDADRAVDRLYAAGLRSRRFVICAEVAHSETIRAVNNSPVGNESETSAVQVAWRAT
jgi:hypothetical protein